MKFVILFVLFSAANAKVSVKGVLHQAMEEQKQSFLDDYIVASYGKPHFKLDSTYTENPAVEDVIRQVANNNGITYKKARSLLLSDVVLSTYRRLNGLVELSKRAIYLQKELGSQGRATDTESSTYKNYKQLKTSLEHYDLDQQLFEIDKIIEIFVPVSFEPSVDVNKPNLTGLDRRLVFLEATQQKRSAGVITILNSLINNTKHRLDVNLARTSTPTSIITAYKKFGFFTLVKHKKADEDKEEYDILERIFNKTTQAKLNFLTEYIAFHMGHESSQKLSDLDSAEEYLENYVGKYVFHTNTSTEMVNAAKLGYLLETSKRLSAQEEFVKVAVRLQIKVNENGGKLDPNSEDYKKYREMQSKLDLFYEAVIEEQVPIDSFIRSFAPINFVPSMKISEENSSILHSYLKRLSDNSEKRSAGMIVLMNRFLESLETPLNIEEAKRKAPNKIYRIIKNNLVSRFPELSSSYIVKTDDEEDDDNDDDFDDDN